MKKFHYHNTEKHIYGGKHIIRKVSIKNGKGYKSVTMHKKGGGKMQKKHTTKRKLYPVEIEHIKNRKFIKGLFSNFMIK
jgi:hypothetical protein